MYDFKVNRRLSLSKMFFFFRRRNEGKFTNCKLNSQSIEWYLTFNQCVQRLSYSASRQPSNLLFFFFLVLVIYSFLNCCADSNWEFCCESAFRYLAGSFFFWPVESLDYISEMLNLIKWAYRGKKLLWTLWSFLDIFFLLHTIAIDLKH